MYMFVVRLYIYTYNTAIRKMMSVSQETIIIVLYYCNSVQIEVSAVRISEFLSRKIV